MAYVIIVNSIIPLRIDPNIKTNINEILIIYAGICIRINIITIGEIMFRIKWQIKTGKSCLLVLIFSDN